MSTINNTFNELRLATLSMTKLKNWYDLALFRFGIINDASLFFKEGGFIDLNKENEAIKVRYKGKEIKFHYDSNKQFKSTLFFIREQFIEDQYEFLNVIDKTVLDIGANVGDSAMYFIANGAKKVYAIEPNPYFYDLAKKNIKSSKINKIQLENLGASGTKILVNSKDMLGEFKSKKDEYKGKYIELITLADMVKRFNLKDAIMKIDCEGAEEWLIDAADTDTLSIFKQIVIAHHNNYNIIETKLNQAGFTTWHTPNKKDKYTRLIFAKRIR